MEGRGGAEEWRLDKVDGLTSWGVGDAGVLEWRDGGCLGVGAAPAGVGPPMIVQPLQSERHPPSCVPSRQRLASTRVSAAGLISLSISMFKEVQERRPERTLSSSAAVPEEQHQNGAFSPMSFTVLLTSHGPRFGREQLLLPPF